MCDAVIGQIPREAERGVEEVLDAAGYGGVDGASVDLILY